MEQSMGARTSGASAQAARIAPPARHSGHSGAKPSFFSDLPARAASFVRSLFEELDRSLAAAHRYEQLRVTCETKGLREDRAGKARQVFAEFYDGQQHRPTVLSGSTTTTTQTGEEQR